ncbi:hypothetical protein CRG98_001456 [Punica granatum]|uniref:Uncharacterized protein n=1 Tax=Punica granatum TaxID=22663 RepID=A0A2I0LBS4_PUNGR|nr:hypothetical protein CRG98_001456 [Punica granatum]
MILRGLIPQNVAKIRRAALCQDGSLRIGWLQIILVKRGVIESLNGRKRYARQVMRVKTMRKRPRDEDPSKCISFSEADAAYVTYPHADALIVTATV